MTNDILIFDTIKMAMSVTGSISTMILVPLLVIGLIIAIFQAATQINEASLSFIPKLIFIFFAVLFMGDILLEQLSELFRYVFGLIPSIAK